MAINVNNFVVERVRRALMMHTATGDCMFTITQVENPSIKCTGESKDAVDAIGNSIITFNTAKKAEISASNSLFDLSLAAAQFGSSKVNASASSKIITPKIEEFETVSSQTTYTLAQVPVGVVGSEIKKIFMLNSDNSIAQSFSLGTTTATASTFLLNASTKEITLPTGLAVGTRMLVLYDYEATSASKITNSASNFPTAGKLVLEVMGSDVCNVSTKYFAYVVCDNASLTSDVDISLATDGKHPFTIKCNQNYCDAEKKLFDIIIAE